MTDETKALLEMQKQLDELTRIYITEPQCRAIAQEEIDSRIDQIKIRTKNRIQRSMERTSFGAVTYKTASIVADKVVQAGGWVAAAILFIAI